MSAKTVRVRIAVAVDAEGNWSCGGWCDDGVRSTDGQAEEAAIDCHVAEGERTTFIEANVPMPERATPETVEGEVVK